MICRDLLKEEGIRGATLPPDNGLHEEDDLSEVGGRRQLSEQVKALFLGSNLFVLFFA